MIEPGHIYILVNPSMEGLVKIGKTTRDPESRARELSQATGVPTPFYVAFSTRAYRLKYGFGVNVEQEIAKNVGVFTRLGWNDGRSEAWTFADVDQTATLGLSIKGQSWGRADDTFGVAGVFNGFSRVAREFFAAGGTGILAGDGNLNYGVEKILETYYDFQIWKTLHATLDYQFVTSPANNSARGPVSVLGARLHWYF